jgi:hypothetical protein
VWFLWLDDPALINGATTYRSTTTTTMERRRRMGEEG